MYNKIKDSELLEKATNEVGNAFKGADKYIDKYRQNILSRYPLLFSFLVTFGVVAVWYGFEAMINMIPFLAGRPILVFFLGIIILLFTGTLYKKLSKSDQNL